ncbi:hypothetical protein [Sporosarcina aquimarina]|uniref:hypothetical protein n=1 Tax=Sporosarcina aquimarina TaxID=114975 RepID=UPI00203AE1DC|nr:hypothetical protein [Sporosarcina aquimarina]
MFVYWNAVLSSIQVDWTYWVLLIVTAIVMREFCTYLWNGVIRETGTSNISLCLNVEPFIAKIISYAMSLACRN